MTVEFTWPTSLDEATGRGIVALYNDAIESTTVIGYTKPLDEEADGLIDDLRQSLDKGDIALFVIRKEAEVIGMAILSSSSMPNCRHIADLSKGIIRSDHQKTGVLRGGFLDIARYCEEKGHELITLDVRENSVPHQIWSGLGFAEYGRLDDYARVDGVSHPGVFMCQKTADLKARLNGAAKRSSPAFIEKEEFKRRLRDELETRITLTHPVVTRIVADQPNWGLLRYMTLQGYQLTKNFLEYIETLYHHCPRNVHKRRLLMNMFEEETGRFSRTDNHVVLMQNFIRAVGISDEERDAAQPLPSTRALIDYRMNLVRDRRTFHMGAAAVMIASEGQNLETTAGEARHDLLPRLYNLTEKDLLFFSIHQKEDVGHVQEGISLVADICDSVKKQQEALEAVRRTCDLFYGMYDGVAEVFPA
ncbi:Pyrroloquinoline quinone (PQQ) biosynthesis protein C [Lysobacter sp. yr284]|uniref:iron-containing redox enzyme family protein n=1 Tax=Lysobacter TaxID=68 RepID=UPI000896965A|nr:iron-containing redox enzyme family protein [Lysobacter sp. yr284]SDY77322.1 Pyrroloquinoline quinone (PQQ) biosynthesis protein C [Lysobacter sp. yr284]